MATDKTVYQGFGGGKQASPMERRMKIPFQLKFDTVPAREEWDGAGAEATKEARHRLRRASIFTSGPRYSKTFMTARRRGV